MKSAVKHTNAIGWIRKAPFACTFCSFHPLDNALLWLFMFGFCATVHGQKVAGLAFPIGEPADHPAAKIKIEEISQGSQKRGFFRISILPLMVVKGVEIRLLRPEIGVLTEIQNTLRTMLKLDAQEFQSVAIFCGDEPTPRLLAEVATPIEGSWALKRVRVKTPSGFRESPDGTLHLTGANSGRLSPRIGEPITLDLTPSPQP